jgi:predicted CopG family antitoxin
MKRIEFRITDDLYQKLEDLRRNMGAISLAEVFRRLVEEAWKREKRR